MSDVQNESSEYFGALLLRERKRQGLTLKKLSEKLGNAINPSYINRLEAGEKDNPSFVVVCALATALSLDLREILKVFGYESLLMSDMNKSIDTIEELIRLNNITSPSSYFGGYSNGKNEYLSQNEKEQLIEILRLIYSFTINQSDNALAFLSQIIDQLLNFRETCQENLKSTSHGFQFDLVSKGKVLLWGKEFEIIVEEEAISSLKSFQISQDELHSVIQRADVRVMDLGERNFFLTDQKRQVSLFCKKVSDSIRVLGVTETFLEVRSEG